MSPTEPASVADALRESIRAALPDSTVVVTHGSAGHFALEVTSKAFEGKSMLAAQRLVYSAIAPLMKGDRAPVHAIDKLVTHVA